MGIKSADASLFQTAVLSAAKNLEAKKEWINELNVFPVPDGDTGTNMPMTIMACHRRAFHGLHRQGVIFRLPARSPR